MGRAQARAAREFGAWRRRNGCCGGRGRQGGGGGGEVSGKVGIKERYGARTGARRTGVRGVATEEWLLWGARASGACAVEPGTSAPDVADVRRLPRPPGIVAALRAVAPDD